MIWKRTALFLIIVLLLTATNPLGIVHARTSQQTDSTILAMQLLEKMTPEERVGQLFLISFQGSDISKNTQLTQLVAKYHVGGVILKNSNDNFVGPDSALSTTYNLTSSLQQIEWDSSLTELVDPQTNLPFTPQYIPLFVGVSQEGDLTPYDQIINGMTPLPNLMSIGATWNTTLSTQVGTVLGSELQSLGFNLLLGPSLDVLDVLQVENGKDLGTRTFGGDPYWVGEMGAAYIQGVHTGSNGRLAVIAKHFPGRGGSDRPPDEEVATVRKSLEQLKQIELAPFFAVTGNATEAGKQTDGLLVSHIRYQGFQGNIRATTRPVSFDRDAMDQLLNLEAFAAWRSTGGVVVSDDLGSQAVRRFYDPTGLTFDARQVARNAFLAGNDLLYVNNFMATGDKDEYTTLVRTLEFFTQKYMEDPAFKQRVDESVARILTLKYKIYFDQFDQGSVNVQLSGLDLIGTSSQVSFDVTRNALTLISPDVNELPEVLPEMPTAGERIVFITDVLVGKQCSTCVEQTAMAVNDFQKTVERLYGEQAGGQVLKQYLSSYTFAELNTMLNNPDEPPPLQSDLNLADWVIFSILSPDSARPESMALNRLLSTRPDLLQNKRVIVFAFNAPFYLDATDISKLTAYYALYSKIPAAVDVAARAVFQEVAPLGNLPISVPAIGYDLIQVTAPDPIQVIPLFLDIPEELGPEVNATGVVITPLPTLIPNFLVGDTLPVKTGVIFDKNGNPVPDGTVVRFTITVSGETGSVQQIDTVTKSGIAHMTYRIISQGLLEVKASSDPALLSQILTLDVSAETVAIITIVAPTQMLINETSTSITPTPTPTEIPADNRNNNPGLGDWLLSMLVIWMIGVAVFYFGRQFVNLRWGLRWGLCTVLGGLLFYTILVLFIPISLEWSNPTGRLGLVVVLLFGCGLGLVVGYFWRVRSMRNLIKPPG